MSKSNNMTVLKKQRALVLGGGGSLGAYEAGVLKVLCKKLAEEDKEVSKKNGENRLLFDIIAGTSIGAMNGAILVSQFLQTGNWEKAAESLNSFWIDKKNGQASTPPQGEIEKVSGWTKWQEASNKNTGGVASKEAARRYYSAKYFSINGVPNMYISSYEQRLDFKFLDDDDKTPKWIIHSAKPLQDSIEHFAHFPIATKFDEKQPRLLVCSVDVAAGETVTFDSYQKSDGSRKSEYGNYIAGKGYENVIRYDAGITIDQVMASGAVPEIYDYREINGHKFWDGGILSNIPFRELLQAHQDYWKNARNNTDDKIPDLEVFIVNLHPSKQTNIPTDYDGVKDRHNDITYSDRNSHYDERVANLITDYKDLINHLKCIARKHLHNKDELHEFEKDLDFLETKKAKSKRITGVHSTYKDLVAARFELLKVVRIEHTNYVNSVSGKTNDLTEETLSKLIKEGKCDAWISLIKEDINNLELDDDDSITVNGIDKIKNSLINMLDQIANSLKENDFEGNEAAYSILAKFVNELDKNKRVINATSKVRQIEKLEKLVESFKKSLEEG